MLLCGEENLREVVLFPMNQRAEDLMMGAPSEVLPKQLRELHIRGGEAQLKNVIAELGANRDLFAARPGSLCCPFVARRVSRWMSCGVHLERPA